MLIPLLTYASTVRAFDCSDYYGLNICSTDFESTDDEITYFEQNQNRFSTKIEEHGPQSGTNQTDDDLHKIHKSNTFKNNDSFRAYMKTIDNSDITSFDSEFSLKKNILDNTNFGLDCRLVTRTIYELSNSNYYDCALQRYF